MKTAVSASLQNIHDRFRKGSREHLSPSYHDPSRTMHPQSAIFGLVSTIVGGGVLSLPFAFAQTGLVLGTALLLGSAAASEFTIQLVVSCARRTGAESFEAIALHAYGPWAQTAVVAVVAALTWMATVAYLVLMTDMIEPLVEELPGQLAIGRHGVTMAAGAGVLPLCLLRSLHALRFTSVLCVAAVSALAGCVAFKSLSEGYAFVPPPAAHHQAEDLRVLVWPRSVAAAWSGTLHALPIFCVSFLCHFNVVSTHTQLHAPSRGRVTAVMRKTVVLCSLLYLFVGILGYLHRLGETKGDVLQNFARGDVVINCGRFALALVLFFSLPLLVLPCREALLRLLSWGDNHRTAPAVADGASGTHGGLATDQGALRALKQPLMGDLMGRAGAPLIEDMRASHRARRACSRVAARLASSLSSGGAAALTVGVLVTATFGALFVPDIVTVWALLGSSVAVLVAFVLPTLFYLAIRAHKPWRGKKGAALLVLVLSVPLAVLGTLQAIEQTSMDRKGHLVDPDD